MSGVGAGLGFGLFLWGLSLPMALGRIGGSQVWLEEEGKWICLSLLGSREI